MDDSNFDKPIEFDKGWKVLQEGLEKLENLVAGKPDSKFTSDEYMRLYETVYEMCTQKGVHDHSQRLYDKYKETFEEYLSSVVLPSLQDKHDPEPLLREFVKRWSNHKAMLRWKMRFFHYLDRYYITRRSIPNLTEVGYNAFHDLVYTKVKGEVRDAVCFLIKQEREGEKIDRGLLKDVVDIFVEIVMKKTHLADHGVLGDYENDFEAKMLEDTDAYYSCKASLWNLEDASPEYNLKVEECLNLEKDRVSHYLHPSTEPKLLERVKQALSVPHAA